MPIQTETRISTRLAYAVILGAVILAAFGLLLASRKTEQSVRPPHQIASGSVPSWCPTRCANPIEGDAAEKQYTIVQAGITRTVTVYDTEEDWRLCIGDLEHDFDSCEVATNSGSGSCSLRLTVCDALLCRYASCGSGSGLSGASTTEPVTSLQEIDRFGAE